MAKDDPDASEDHIAYGRLMHDAMRRLIHRVLSDVATTGLPGEHHFFITFDTNYPGVDIADWLHERYPDDMTIVIQHWFADLEVTPDRFAITLNFGDNPERLVVPFNAVLTFVDPSVEFGLRFETAEADEEARVQTGDDSTTAAGSEAGEDDRAPAGDADVVNLDAFRK